MAKIDLKHIEDTHLQYVNITKILSNYIRNKKGIDFVYNVTWEVLDQKDSDSVVIIHYSTPNDRDDMFYYSDTLIINVGGLVKELNNLNK